MVAVLRLGRSERWVGAVAMVAGCWGVSVGLLFASLKHTLTGVYRVDAGGLAVEAGVRGRDPFDRVQRRSAGRRCATVGVGRAVAVRADVAVGRAGAGVGGAVWVVGLSARFWGAASGVATGAVGGVTGAAVGFGVVGAARRAEVAV